MITSSDYISTTLKTGRCDLQLVDAHVLAHDKL